MITPDMIPDEVWHTAMSTYHKTIKKRPGSAWQEAIAAALNVWPGMHTGWQCIGCGDNAQIILPLPQQEKGGQ